MLKISIITIAFNNEVDIRQTIESVISQDYVNIEYIIVDGNSTDKTLEIIYEYDNYISKIISEPDENLYDAINKGIMLSSGDIVGLIHSGDRLYDNTVIASVVEHFEKHDIDISYGHSKIIKGNRTIRINRSSKFNVTKVRHGWMPSHQSIYVKRSLFVNFGLYRTDLGGIADYEWFIRYFYVNQPKVKLLNRFIVKFYVGGISTKSYKSRLEKKQKVLVEKCWLINEVKPPFGIVYWKLIRKPIQFVYAFIDEFLLRGFLDG